MCNTLVRFRLSYFCNVMITYMYICALRCVSCVVADCSFFCELETLDIRVRISFIYSSTSASVAGSKCSVLQILSFISVNHFETLG